MSDETDLPTDDILSIVRKVTEATQDDHVAVILLMSMAVGLKDSAHGEGISFSAMVSAAMQALENLGLAGTYTKLIRAGLTAASNAPPPEDGDTANVVQLFKTVVARAA